MTKNKLLLAILVVIVIAAAAIWIGRTNDMMEPAAQGTTEPAQTTDDNGATVPASDATDTETPGQAPVFDERNWVCTLWEDNADGIRVCTQWSVRREATTEEQ